ncbi:hypothetical protein [Pedobacter roseus]|nr:hypothetical protein [Pedobacter roseus]
MLRYEASTTYETDASYLSMTAYSGLLQIKRISISIRFSNAIQ